MPTIKPTTTGEMADIAVLHGKHKSVPADYAASKLAEQIMSHWGDPWCVDQTAKLGVDDDDKQMIRKYIAEYSLECTQQQAEAALLAECRRQAEERKQRA